MAAYRRIILSIFFPQYLNACERERSRSRHSETAGGRWRELFFYMQPPLLLFRLQGPHLSFC